MRLVRQTLNECLNGVRALKHHRINRNGSVVVAPVANDMGALPSCRRSTLRRQ